MSNPSLSRQPMDQPASPGSDSSPAIASQDLAHHPIWRAEQLGEPIPASPHAVSVAMPRWQDVVDYEEKAPAITNRLSTGYPRFVIHPLIKKLLGQVGAPRPALPFPSLEVARLCQQYVQQTTGEPAEIFERHGVVTTCTTAKGEAALQAFWQHTGLILSTRRAEAFLAGQAPDPAADAEVMRALRQQLAGFYDCAEDDVFLAPTGMASIFAALQALKQRTPGHPTVQLGFPYVDTLKVQQKFGVGGILLHHLGSADSELEALLERQPLAGCFCEIPGNPLLGSVDLQKVRPVLRRHHVPLVVDDVVATAVNVDLSRHADLVATSLTKFIVGTCNAMGGALICNPRSPLYQELKPILRAQHQELLWGADAAVLNAQAKDFPERMKRHNQNGLLIAERLRAHPCVEQVWYPKWEFSEAYETVRRPQGGWGALITFLPRNGATRSPVIYDRLPICKGPSLGTVFTLACPFTLLAHYTELDWAESCGVSRHLIRLSVGLEDPEELWGRLDKALRDP